MRLQRHLENNVEGYFVLFESVEMNEMTTETFEKLKSIGKRMGFKIKKSKSLVDYIKGAGRGIEDLLRYTTLYMMTDVTDSRSRKELVRDAKKVIKSVRKEDLTAFLIQLDKVSLGLSSHIRHIFQSVFGVEIATINNWIDDAKYIEKELRHVRRVLERMGGMEDEIKALDKFENSLKDTLEIARS